MGTWSCVGAKWEMKVLRCKVVRFWSSFVMVTGVGAVKIVDDVLQREDIGMYFVLL
jgi:hypothetical protein